MGVYQGWDRPTSFSDLDDVWDRSKKQQNIPTQVEELQKYLSKDMPYDKKSLYSEFNSFSGVDIVAYINIPPADGAPTSDSKTTQGILGTLQTLSYSIHREVVPVRAIGKVRAHSYTKGPRTIAGTMVWAVMDQYVLSQALRDFNGEPLGDTRSILVDQLPPFDIVITFNNEYGDVSQMGLFGIRMVNEGSTYSIDDMMTEQTNTYVATDIDLLHKLDPFHDKLAGTIVKTSDQILIDQAKKRMSAHRSPFL